MSSLALLVAATMRAEPNSDADPRMAPPGASWGISGDFPLIMPLAGVIATPNGASDEPGARVMGEAGL